MKAAVVHSFEEPLVVENVPVPEPGPEQVLVRIETCGLCHTDIHAARGEWRVKPTPPFIPGHEGAGIVAAVGPGVTGLKEGDPVGIAWLHDACGVCESCITGWETLCPSQHNSGYGVNGSFAEYAIGSAAYVARLPDRPDFHALAPILCAGVTTYKGIKEAEVRPGEWLPVDEYMVLLPSAESAVTVSAGDERTEVVGSAVVVVPPGPSEVTIGASGVVSRVFSTQSPDLADRCRNADAYASPDPNVAAF